MAARACIAIPPADDDADSPTLRPNAVRAVGPKDPIPIGARRVITVDNAADVLRRGRSNCSAPIGISVLVDL
jgi:hypothetical protein